MARLNGSPVRQFRGTTAQHSTYTGPAGELTVDTTKKVVVVHDGATAGGVPMAREDRKVTGDTHVQVNGGTEGTLASDVAVTLNMDTIAADLVSGDANNGLSVGTDNKLFAKAPDADLILREGDKILHSVEGKVAADLSMSYDQPSGVLNILGHDGTTVVSTVTIPSSTSAGGGYELCEFYFFRHPTLKPGFQPAQGGLLENAATLYPEAWAYLQTTEGQKLCKTEAEWQAMTQAIWHTNADGTTVGWNGIGGAPFYALHTDTGALRLPDLRGMYAEAAGFDSLSAGGAHGDAVRNIVGGHYIGGAISSSPDSGFGAFVVASLVLNQAYYSAGTAWGGAHVSFNSSLVVPTAAKNAPRAWGALPCVYLGQPAS